MAKKAFEKFIVREEKGAKKKEIIRQEKKKQRQETKEYFAKKKEERQQGWIARKDDAPAERPARRSVGKVQGPVKKSNDFQKKSAAPALRGPETPLKRAKPVLSKTSTRNAKESESSTVEAVPAGAMPLNKFIAHSGICSRRDAAGVVKSGKVTVNDQTILEPGFKVNPKDEVKVSGKKIAVRRNLVYILLNKPKDYITTMEDPEGRKTVLEIIKHATTERVYPVGRLDRNTTGVLLFTNDGELAQKLSHPSYQVRKIYEVRLDKPLAKKDFDSLLAGITLEDGPIAPDSLAYADSKDKSIIGIEIHSGRNRIVRRIFESLGYDVRNLDRVMFANLTKKNVERGKWRFLSEKEVRLLKFMNASYSKKSKTPSK